MRKAATLGAALLAAALTALSQQDAATISGRITDVGGGVVPGADIVLREASTHLTFTSRTNQLGIYRSPPLPPGRYEITIQKAGFQRAVTAIYLEVGQSPAVDAELHVGDISQQLTVNAAAPLLSAETTSLGNVRDQRAVSGLPLNARNFAFLFGLGPGTVPTYSQSASIPGASKRGVTTFAVNGMRPTNDFNSVRIEGIDNADNHNGLGAVVFPPIEAIQEFSISTSGADAQYGNASGGFINIELKSGGRLFHGELYEFLRNSAFDAKNFFDSPLGESPHLTLNQFGGNLGGPLWRPALRPAAQGAFFFLSTEGDIRRQAQTFLNTVPLLAAKQGDFSQYPQPLFDPLTTMTVNGQITRERFQGNVIPSSRFDAAGLNIIGLYPAPNLPGRANNYLYNPVATFGSQQTDMKVDSYFGSSDSASVRGSFGNAGIYTPAALPLPAAGGPSGAVSGNASVLDVQIGLTEHHVFSPRLVNEVRAGFARIATTLENVNGNIDLSSQLGIPGANVMTPGLTSFQPTNFAGLGDYPATPSFFATNNFQGEDNLRWNRGRLSMRTGVQLERKQYNAFQSTSTRGVLNFNGGFTASPNVSGASGISLADLLLGLPASGNLQIMNGLDGFRRTELSLYLQADWKVTPQLTLNLGLRYENYFGYPWNEVANRQTQFLANTGQLVPAGINGVSASGAPNDGNNWAPRAGLAYRLTENTVIRAAYGIYYAAPADMVTQNLSQNPPFATALAFSNNMLSSTPARTLAQGFEAGGGFSGAPLNALDMNLALPYVQQWNFAIQQQVHGEVVLTVAYVGNDATKLVDLTNINEARPGPGPVAPRRPFPGFGDIQLTGFEGNSSYNALQLSAEKRLTRGLGFLLAYSYGHAIDGTASIVTEHQDMLNLRADRSSSDYDVRHSFTASFNYEIPVARRRAFLRIATADWQLNGILRLSTGLPFNITSATNTLNGSGLQRADLVAGCEPNLAHPSPAQWFGTACFVTPPQFQFGDAGRNLLYGPGTRELDASLFRTIRISSDGGKAIELRCEVFNVSNTPQFNNPAASIGSAVAGAISSAGSPPTFQRTSRQIQIAAKLSF